MHALLQLSLGPNDFSQHKVFLLGDALGRNDQDRVAVAGHLVFVVRHELAGVPDALAVLGVDVVPIDGHVHRFLHLGGHHPTDQTSLGQGCVLVADGWGVHERVVPLHQEFLVVVVDVHANGAGVDQFLVGHALVLGGQKLGFCFFRGWVVIAGVLEGFCDFVRIVRVVVRCRGGCCTFIVIVGEAAFTFHGVVVLGGFGFARRSAGGRKGSGVFVGKGRETVATQASSPKVLDGIIMVRATATTTTAAACCCRHCSKSECLRSRC
mmetsp:Transcript_26886/g.59013  ORF Transcript_26886/g.59013 Transcript_26886/m.59013 type:complete len:266 (+) Transcript_26886:346-1143(+)